VKRKLHLALDDLTVETFETSDAESTLGTVEAYVSPRCVTNNTCDEAANTCGDNESCGAWPSCYVSCATNCPVAECQGGGDSGYTFCNTDCPECSTQPVTFCTC
jgi:hypothetical protein